MPGGVTRLLACDEKQLQNYKGLHLGNTFVHRNYGRIGHKRRVPEGETHPPTGSRDSDSERTPCAQRAMRSPARRLRPAALSPTARASAPAACDAVFTLSRLHT
jgi:hypothetical protein